LIEIAEAQVAGLEKLLDEEAGAGREFRAYHGMKHQRPYLEDAVGQMADDGIERAVGLVLAPHYSRFSVGEYVERGEQAARDAGAARLDVPSYRAAWQSAGRTGEPWLGPDLTDVLRELAEQGVPAAVSCPVGFVCDHLEILYDIDIEAQAVAREVGLTLVRTESPNDDPRFLAALAEVIRDHLREEAQNE